ncbi:hypothetical protein GTQ34_13855 [Muricauda sp. JGD-17]|uniref:Uncharacterized protein n=2 Tax=Flagellimonas ochracea TaxID=2696472 RepID=A0A964TDP7_9FLAO|nr:hypothetical protein [Allomuricauda ochracea]
MKERKAIIVFLAGAFLVGYVIFSITLFKEAFQIVANPDLTPNLVFMNITSALTGLVGGIVATAFGVQVPKSAPPKGVNIPISRRQLKMQSLGTYSSPAKEDKQKELFGSIYAWAYILIGLASVVIWAFLSTKTENVPQNVANMGTTFLGMAIAIVGAWLRPTG